MAVAIVTDPTGAQLDRIERPSGHRAWLSAQGIATYTRADGEVVLRWPAGTTVRIDGELHKRLRTDGAWEDVLPSFPSPAPPPPPTGGEE